MHRNKRKAKCILLIAVCVFTLVILCCFLGLTVQQEKIIKNSIALSADRLFDSIVLTRKWNARYGGVFVLKTESIQSNPYLENPDILSTTGLAYTLKNPALMTREISELADKEGSYQFHITSLKLLNPHNAVDAWEREALEAFEEGEIKKEEVVEKEGKKIYRMIRPLLVEPECMKCHARQGYVRGEVRGGISVSLPFDKVARSLFINRVQMATLAFGIILLFYLLCYFIIWRLITNLFATSSELQKQKRSLEVLNANLDREIEERTGDLRKSEKRFRSTFEQAPFGICHVDLNGHFLRYNSKFMEIFGYSYDDLRKKLFPEIFYQDEFKIFLKKRKALLEDGAGVISCEEKYIDQNSAEIWVNLIAFLVRNEHGEPEYFIDIVKDVSERKKLEKHLQQAQKLEALGTLAGGIAHDFNNILTPILGFTEMSMVKLRSDDPLYENLQVIFNAACRAKELTRQILTFSRANSPNYQPFEIIFIIKEVFNLLRSSLPSSIEMILHLDIHKGVIVGNPIEIHQVVMNLCTNASHAIGPSPGTIHLTVSEKIIQQGESSVPLAAGSYISLEVSDSGSGMEKAIVDRIFDPYFTTKNKGEGTGLGLAQVHRIVENLKGFISVYSEPGVGTTFRILLPCFRGAEEHIEPIEMAADIQGGSEHILLVDDEQIITAMQSMMLADLGYQVTVVNDSVKALEMLKRESRRFDLVITDMTMPHITGLMLIQELEHIRPDLPVILCTGFSSQFTIESLKEASVFAVLTKPVFKTEFCQTVRSALDKMVSL